jgi:hypothetical protein
VIVVGVQESKYGGGAGKKKKSMRVKRKVPKTASMASAPAGAAGGDGAGAGGGPVVLAVLPAEEEYEEIEEVVEGSDEDDDGDGEGEGTTTSTAGTAREDDSDLEEEALMEAVLKAAAEVRAADAAGGASAGAGAIPGDETGADGAPRKMKRKKRFAGVAAASLVGEHAEIARRDAAEEAEDGADPAVGLSPRRGSDAGAGAGGKPPTPTSGGAALPVAYSAHHPRAASRGMRGSLTEHAPAAAPGSGGGGILGALVSGQFAAFVKHAATQSTRTPVFEAIKEHVGVGSGWVEVASVMMWQTGVIVLARE